MNRLKLLFAALLCAATAAVVPAANAQTVHYVGAGSSAMFQGFLVAAANDMATVVGQPINRFHHWSVKNGNAGCTTPPCAAIIDNRSGAIPPEAGNLWVVWADNGAGVVTDVWAYLSVDSVVGVRAFLGGAKIVLGGGIGTTTSDNVSSPGLFSSGAGLNGATANCPAGFTASATSTCDDQNLPAGVISLLGGSGAGAIGHVITAGMTDIRPEDAKYATNRALGSTVDTSATGVGCAGGVCRSWSLGYGPGPVGAAIVSGMGSSTSKATPVQFGLPGFADPITGVTVPNTIQTFPIGVAPIIFVVNRTNPSGLGQTLPSDGSYYARNVWDQHPFPPNGTPPAPTTRRPLGNLFTGHDCGTDNAAFTWPADTGTRIPAGQPGGPVSGVIPGLAVFLREPLSGTMNTTEFTEFRIYGTTNGNGPTGNGQPALTSQEQDVNPKAGDNPLKQKPCVAGGIVPTGGYRTRAIGTGEVISGKGSGAFANGNGILNTPDSIGYTFFSFANVGAIATKDTNPIGGTPIKQPGFGYLMIDGIDPIFDFYDNSSGTPNPGQPAVAGSPLTWGELPGCAVAPGSLMPDCRKTGIWGAKNSFPHLRDGSYPAWSELRMLCNTTNTNCLATSDAAGAEGLVQNAQFDVHNNNLGGVPDFLPFSQASSGALSFTPPFGDVSFVRQHFSYILSLSGAALLPTPTTTHESNPQVVFQSEGCSGGAAPGTPKTGPTPSDECGGDVGGLVVPAGSTATGLLQ